MGPITARLRVVTAVALLLAAGSLPTSAQQSIRLAFYRNGAGYIATRTAEGQPTPELAARLLVAGPTSQEAAQGVDSAIPPGTALVSLTAIPGGVEIDLSKEAAAGLDELRLESIFRQFLYTMEPFGLDASVRLKVEGRPISSYLAPTPAAIYSAPTAAAARKPVASGVGLSGKRITVSPGHGYYYTGSLWTTQRGSECGNPPEDFHNLKFCRYLEALIEGDGGYVQPVREFDLNRGNGPSGHPWWQESAYAWLKDAGYTCSVYGSSSLVCSYTGADHYDDDIRARPLASNLDSRGNTDLLVSIHTNAFDGTVSGSDIFYNNDAEHADWADESYALAEDIHGALIAAISASGEKRADGANYVCHGSCAPRYGNFGEIRIPHRPATLLEVGYHDNCSTDAPKLEESFFQSVAMWGVYNGICQYLGNTPTWAMYSSQYVSDDIPATVTQGNVRTVHITFRNKGVLWSDAKSFHLGAVGDSDPFAGNRQSVTGEVGPGETYTFTFNMAFTGLGNQVTDWRMVRDGYQWFGDTLTKTVYVTASGDTQPPTVPTNLHVTGVTYDTVSLAWTASTDNFGVMGYRIYRDGAVVGSTTGLTYTDTALSAGTTYSYQVEAYDGVPNYSGPSSAVDATTPPAILLEGFNGSLANWFALGGPALTYSTSRDHGQLTGPGSAYAQAGSARQMYHWLDSVHSLSSGGYKTLTATGWLYDTQGTVTGLRTGMRLFFYDSAMANKAIYWIGATSQDPPNLGTHYIGAVTTTDTTYYDLGTRSTGWHKLEIEVLPYTGSNDLKFYVDGALKATASQPAVAANCVMRRIFMGYNAEVGADHYYDDFVVESTAPAAPSNLSGAALSTDSIRWSFTDNASNEIGFRIYDGTAKVAQREEMNVSYVDETGLAANVIYARMAKAYAGVLESAPSPAASACTLSVPPTTSNVTCNKPTEVWQGQNPFDFTAVGGFGPTTLAHYRYAWDQQPTHTSTGTESTWSADVKSLNAAASASPWYFHVQGFNQYDQANGTLDLGPYRYDGTPPSQPVVTDDGATTTSLSTLHATWSASDAESGVQGYQYAIGTSAGGTDIVDWTAPVPETAATITRSDLSLADGLTYYVSVKARNAAQLWSAVGSSDGIAVQVPAVSILGAKGLADGVSVKITGRTVSAVFAGEFYIQEPNRSSGIRVVWAAPVDVGAVVDVVGTIHGAGGERYVAATSVTPH